MISSLLLGRKAAISKQRSQCSGCISSSKTMDAERHVPSQPLNHKGPKFIAAMLLLGRHECCSVGAEDARPSSAHSPRKAMCFCMTSRGTCLVSKSAGFSRPGILVKAKSLRRKRSCTHKLTQQDGESCRVLNVDISQWPPLHR